MTALLSGLHQAQPFVVAKRARPMRFLPPQSQATAATSSVGGGTDNHALNLGVRFTW
jgi:hypothetical protein